MNEQLITSKIQQINSVKSKTGTSVFFLDYLLAKQFTDKKAVKRIPKFGCAKGTFKLKGHLKWQTILTNPWTILRTICHEFIARLE